MDISNRDSCHSTCDLRKIAQYIVSTGVLELKEEVPLLNFAVIVTATWFRKGSIKGLAAPAGAGHTSEIITHRRDG